MYPPLTGTQYSPGLGADFWLLGIGFIEISAIAGAIELIVGVLRTRAPGMTLDRMPIFAWTMLIFAGMIVFAFPAVILATLLLELERAFGWPFFIPQKGGDALLWQHLFWFFGHPEVYIIFLPAAGMVSMIVPTMARAPLVGYRLIVVALIATGFFSFGLWVHHMFTTGIPALSLSFFSAASMAVAIPSGIQVFAWIATIASGRLRLATPSLFVLGFLFIFTLGGLTGVMVAMVPFDWQAHDTYFVVAHFHYVLVGGMVFPLFAAFYYWAPAFSRRALSERLGKLTFCADVHRLQRRVLPDAHHRPDGDAAPRLHLSGRDRVGRAEHDLHGRRVPVRGRRAGVPGRPRAQPAPDRLGAGRRRLEGRLARMAAQPHLRPAQHSAGREPRSAVGSARALRRTPRPGATICPAPITGVRETIVTSPIEATPQALLRLPGYGWTPLLAAVFTAGFFMLLTVKLVTLALVSGVLAVAVILIWMWSSDPKPHAPCRDRPRHQGADLCVRAALAFVVGDGGAAAGRRLALSRLRVLLSLSLDRLAAGLAQAGAASIVDMAADVRRAARGEQRRRSLLAAAPCPSASRNNAVFVALLAALAVIALAGGLGAEVLAHWRAGLRPDADAHAAMVYMASFLQLQLVLALVVMAAFAVARRFAGMLNRRRRVVFDNLALLWHYTVAQGLLGLLLVHGFPRIAG